jgi:cellulose synthase/poly-beta-1,6-N-acetylglucosamine synthase-like glycosyltransferase
LRELRQRETQAPGIGPLFVAFSKYPTAAGRNNNRRKQRSIMIWNREFSEGDGGKISIVIPVLNESATITSVVQYALSSPMVDEVIVVDDGSIDGTPELAAAAGARVITSTEHRWKTACAPRRTKRFCFSMAI